jgi:bacterioferritin-associated ferredoxin
MHCGSCADLAESILNENQAAPSHAGPRMFVPSLA